MSNIINFKFSKNKTNLRTQVIDGEPYFALQDVCTALSLNNISKLKERLDQKGVILKLTPTKGGNQDMYFINEKNLYKCIFKSKKQEAIFFQDWIFGEVLPQIRKTGSYSIYNTTELHKHTDINFQKQNSKTINSIQYNQGGVDAIKNYNKENCKIHSGKTTTQIKQEGISKGLKKAECQSAKQVLRNIKPEIACAMSFADSLISMGKTLEEVSPATRAAISVFDHLIKIGITPIELEK